MSQGCRAVDIFTLLKRNCLDDCKREVRKGNVHLVSACCMPLSWQPEASLQMKQSGCGGQDHMAGSRTPTARPKKSCIFNEHLLDNCCVL